MSWEGGEAHLSWYTPWVLLSHHQSWESGYSENPPDVCSIHDCTCCTSELHCSPLLRCRGRLEGIHRTRFQELMPQNEHWTERNWTELNWHSPCVSSKPSPSWESRYSENPPDACSIRDWTRCTPDLHCSLLLWCRGCLDGIQDMSHNEVPCLWSV